MKPTYVFLIALLLLGSSCQSISQDIAIIPQMNTEQEVIVTIPEFSYPIDHYQERLTFKKFGQEVHDRFNGFHTGDDLEVENTSEEVPIYAIADGKVIYKNSVSGYGGVLIIQHEIDGQPYQSLYGHIDLSQTRPNVGDLVQAGTKTTYLGDDQSKETDGERKHLHFGIYKGNKVQLAGYVPNSSELSGWINPSTFLSGYEAKKVEDDLPIPSVWKQQSLKELSELYNISLSMPAQWMAEYIPENESINIYDPTLPGESSLDKSVLFVRYFDADNFLTLSSVTIHSKYLATVKNHDAVTYEIEKKPTVSSFSYQPDWRNKLHQVTDIREQKGFSRFYVMGQNPETAPSLLFAVINSIVFTP